MRILVYFYNLKRDRKRTFALEDCDVTSVGEFKGHLIVIVLPISTIVD